MSLIDNLAILTLGLLLTLSVALGISDYAHFDQTKRFKPGLAYLVLGGQTCYVYKKVGNKVDVYFQDKNGGVILQRIPSALIGSIQP